MCSLNDPSWVHIDFIEIFKILCTCFFSTYWLYYIDTGSIDEKIPKEDKYKLEEGLFRKRFRKPDHDIFKGEGKVPGQSTLYRVFDQHKKE
jgi:hypothetical protein